MLETTSTATSTTTPARKRRRVSSMTTAQIRHIARKHSVSEKDGTPRKIFDMDIEAAIREVLELVGVPVKQSLY